MQIQKDTLLNNDQRQKYNWYILREQPTGMRLAKTSFVFFIFIFLQVSPGQIFSQANPGAAKDSVLIADEEMKIFEAVEIEATYPGGNNAWRSFLERNLKADVPANKKAPAGAYTVVIQFVVDKEGNVSDIKPLTSHGYGMEDEVVRILKKAPRWKPAIQDGRPVRAYRKQPVTFMVIEEKNWKRKNDRSH